MKYLVTGGGGFLGSALCRRLIETGHEVVSISRGKYSALEEQGIVCVRADISTGVEEWGEAFQGVDAVFHTAAKVEMWGDYDEFFAVNVVGTRNIIQACQIHSVPGLVYTSSPSVVADGTSLRGIDESYPYPKKHAASYPATKAIAEREVLAASSDAFRTLVLRPHLIFGPGDTNLIPTVLNRARSGKLVQIGEGRNKVDLCFIEDCVKAHLLAARALENTPSARDKVYFISQGEPVYLWDWINDVLRRNQLPPVKRRLSFRLADSLAAVLELFARLCPGQREPLLSRFLVSEMATDHYFDISRARQELGFEPEYSVAAALDLTFPL